MPKQTPVAMRKKVIKAKMENPDLSIRDIAKQEGLWKNAVENVLKEIPWIVKTSEYKQAEYIATLDSIINGIAEITQKHIKALADKEIEKASDLKAYNEISDMNWKRKQILQWWVTDRVWVNIDVDNSTDDEINQSLQAKIRK